MKDRIDLVRLALAKEPGINKIRLRAMLQGRKGFRSSNEVTTVIAQAIDAGFIKVVETPQPGSGKPAVALYWDATPLSDELRLIPVDSVVAFDVDRASDIVGAITSIQGDCTQRYTMFVGDDGQFNVWRRQ